MVEQYRGFEFDVLVSLVRGQECGGNFTARPVTPEMKDLFAKTFGLPDMRMPIHVINAPGGVNMETWPKEYFAEIARQEIDKAIADREKAAQGQEGHG